MSGRWYSMDAEFTVNEQVEALGEEFGPGGPLVIVALMGKAALQHQTGGRIKGTFKHLADHAYIERSETRKVIQRAGELGILTVEEVTDRGFEVVLNAWQRWQDAHRKRASRAETSENVQKRPETSENVRARPEPSPTEQNKTEQNKTTTEPKTTELLVENLPSPLQPLVATFNRVVDEKRARPLKLDAWMRYGEKFADRDLALEAEKFEHYWLHGAGQNRVLKDVAGAWRNWLRNAPPRNIRSFASPSNGPVTKRVEELLSRSTAIESTAQEVR